MGGQNKNRISNNGKFIIHQYNFNSIVSLYVLRHQEFYLGTPMEQYGYICLTLNIIPGEIIKNTTLEICRKIDMSMLISEKECTYSHRKEE